MKKFLSVLVISIFLIVFSLPVFAFDVSSYQPFPPDCYAYNVVFLSSTGGPRIYSTSIPMKSTSSTSVNSVTSCDYKEYIWEPYASCWVLNDSNTGIASLNSTEVSNLQWANYDIVSTSDGSVFFSIPKPPPISALAQPQNLLQVLLQHLPIILPVGILILCLVTLGPKLLTWVPRLFLG